MTANTQREQVTQSRRGSRAQIVVAEATRGLVYQLSLQLFAAISNRHSLVSSYTERSYEWLQAVIIVKEPVSL